MEFTAAEIEEFQRGFELLNPESDNNVTTRDLDHVMRALGRHATDKELQSMINEVDQDGNGFLDFQGFLQVMTMKMCYEPDDEDMRETFRVFDKANTGYIAQEQLRHILSDLSVLVGDEEVDEMIRTYDLDGDGRLNYEEFIQMMTSK